MHFHVCKDDACISACAHIHDSICMYVCVHTYMYECRNKGIKVLLLYSTAQLNHMVSVALYNLTPGRGLTQPWCEPSP